jgi:hypothetical protein
MATSVTIAKPTFVTGKTNQSQVVDVYKGSAELSLAQNNIVSVLSGIGSDLIEDTKNGVLSVFKGEKFVKNAGALLDDVLKAGLTGKSVSAVLKNYKEGALTSVLNASGLKDIEKFGRSFTEGLTHGVKDMAFGSVKGFVDQVAPGVLDKAGIKNYKDAKTLYDSINNEIENGKSFSEILIGNKKVTLGLSSFLMDTSLDIVSTALGIAEPLEKAKDVVLDSTILTIAAKSLIAENDPDMVDYIFSSIGDPELKKMFVAQSTTDAVSSGSFNYVNAAADATSPSFVKGANQTPVSDFLSSIKIKLPGTNQEMLSIADQINKAVETLTGKKDEDVPVETFSKMSEVAYETMIREGKYLDQIAIAKVINVGLPDDLHNPAIPFFEIY